MIGFDSCQDGLRRRLYALFGALVLAAACLQALEPVAAPLERIQGSAFSAATADVAVVRARAGEAQRLASIPVPLPAPPAPVPVTPPDCAAPPGTAPRPDSTGPPPCDLRLLRPGPRAPPPA